eukprot:TRINITY_DN6091_c0_g1_i1.p2 TRINITY_DN6091_c0_g1~~TRINITY_DN6091_c0_g1_i1.p2  ORF type:complete len:109 (+),score=34.43 TRINITY_DN6091_c0_g1_i1:33-329(+)
MCIRDRYLISQLPVGVNYIAQQSIAIFLNFLPSVSFKLLNSIGFAVYEQILIYLAFLSNQDILTLIIYLPCSNIQNTCLLYTSPSPRDKRKYRMQYSA